MADRVRIPASLLPQDGRFGSGPSRVTDRQLASLMAAQTTVLGTSHRQDPVKNLVGDVRAGLADFFSVPDGYEVVLGNGGATMFWDVAVFSLIRDRAQHCAFGEFGAKFAAASTAAPHLGEVSLRESPPGTVIAPAAEEGIDSYAWTHNETSTGALAPVKRPEGIEEDALTIVDGTSAAGGTFVDITETDVYYFAPQKGFASDGGLWCAILSPRALARMDEIARSGRYIPPSLNLTHAVENSRKNQTYNTPAIATLVLMNDQIQWLRERGGMEWAAARTAESSGRIYAWAGDESHIVPYVTNPWERSPVVLTLNLVRGIRTGTIREALRDNGIVDIDPYRKLGENQLRIGTYPAVDPEDATALTNCLTWLLEEFDGAGEEEGGTLPD